jgi:hypothetical protein
MSEKPISPLRRRMIEDMSVRNFVEKTPQRLYPARADLHSFPRPLERPLQPLLIVQPAANLGNPLATDADLLRTSTSIGHRQNEHPVSLAARAFLAALGMSDGAQRRILST